MWDLSSWAQSLGLAPAAASKASASSTAPAAVVQASGDATRSRPLEQPFERLTSTGCSRVGLMVEDLPDDCLTPPSPVGPKKTLGAELLSGPSELAEKPAGKGAVAASSSKARTSSSSRSSSSKGRLKAPTTVRSLARLAETRSVAVAAETSFESAASRSFESSASRPITQSFESNSSGNSTKMPRSPSPMSPPTSADFTDALAAARNKVVGSITRATSSGRNSSDFDASCNACIMYDWDDTLCPTTWAFAARAEGVTDCQQLQARFGGELEALASITEQVLRESRKVARVAIITLADKDWFQESCQLFYPGLDMRKLLQELGVKIYFASRPPDEQDFEELRVAAKKKVMAKCLSTFYPFLSSKRAVKWNVLSIGDALTEHQALKQALSEASPSAGAICKTLKFADKPSLERLNAQLQSLPPHLERMIKEKKDFDRNSALLWIGGKKG
eukprot:TRINITY_DN943_c0_g1_i1.p1 TRINITY_DN943_c0_g1~~TRINITY_DN943_c0_g1_i1.p1  ORF type:complete len:448 (+),score=117.28 TRINITY_DN943_c0_g1_i1:99-1442(+)